MTNYVDAFRDPSAARALAGRVRDAAAALPRERTVRLMEVCGTHTMAIGRAGLRRILPETVDLISGPGCPVCVTSPGYVDAAIELARRGTIVATFGDLLHVPGSETSLAMARSAGARVEICHSPERALELARAEPGREVVFLAVGFETTAAPVVSLAPMARAAGVRNISLLVAFKRIPPALDALARDPDVRIDGFLCPAHVSAIIGADAYEPFVATHRRPCVIAGFEPLDILYGVEGLLRQVAAGEARVENQYSRVVRPEGNRLAQRRLDECLEAADADWRGIGTLPDSGWRLRPEWAEFDAERRHGIAVKPGRESPGCRCGDVLRGKLKPPECPIFRRGCDPTHPVGPCMVSSEGACAAWYRYE